MNPTSKTGPEGPPGDDSGAGKLPALPPGISVGVLPASSPGAPPADSAEKLLAEIADLAASPVPEPVFLQEVLKRSVALLGGEAGAIWMFDAERRLVLQAEVRLQATGFLDDPALRAGCERPFSEVLAGGGVRHHEIEQATLREGLRKRSILLGGLARGEQVAGLVQVFESAAAPEEVRPARLRILEEICSRAAQFWRPKTKSPTPEPARGTAGSDQWTLALHESRKSAEVAVVACNECRRLLGVDRVSIGERHGPGVKILAVSGQQSVNARSNVVRLLSQLATEVLRTGEKLAFAGDTRNLPPQIEKLLADYLHESRSRAVVVVPVAGPAPHDEESQDSAASARREQTKPKPVGVVVVEQVSETPLPVDLDARLDVLGAHVGLALFHAQASERIFLLSLWTFLGNWKSRLKGRRLLQIAAVIAAVALIGLALVVVPWEYRVVGKGRLMPVERRGIFAPWDGEVVALAVKSGQPVEKGALLVSLKNVELQANLLKQTNLLQEKKKQRAAIAAQLSEPAVAANPATAVELRGKFMQMAVEIAGAEEQARILSQQVEDLSIRAPIAGVVATFRIEEMLRERPVKRGELLLEVMDPRGRWRLELDVPENRLGHILGAQQKHDDGRLPLRYVLATATESTYEGSLDSISTRSVISETEGSVVPLFASLSNPAPPDPRIGSEVIAKIDCGRRSLGYVLFGDVIEFIRKRFWL